jgi:hypothetical protein
MTEYSSSESCAAPPAHKAWIVEGRGRQQQAKPQPKLAPGSAPNGSAIEIAAPDPARWGQYQLLQDHGGQPQDVDLTSCALASTTVTFP